MQQPDWAAYEQVVGKRWPHYAPCFERFALGGWLSWNRAAFFGTFAWLQYRKLRDWSWLYFFVSSPVLITALSMFSIDPCGFELEASPWMRGMMNVVIVLFALGWIVPPLIADRLYFNRVKSLVESDSGRDEVKPSPGGFGGAIALQLFVLGFATIALPSYGHYTYRARVSEGVSLTFQFKTPLAEYYADYGRLPERIDELGGTLSGRYVSTVVLENDGSVRATFGDTAGLLSGHSLRIVPVNKSLSEWICRSDDLPSACLPMHCRQMQ